MRFVFRYDCIRVPRMIAVDMLDRLIERRNDLDRQYRIQIFHAEILFRRGSHPRQNRAGRIVPAQFNLFFIQLFL